MLLYVLAFVGGILTIVSPCILPVLPFVFSRADQQGHRQRCRCTARVSDQQQRRADACSAQCCTRQHEAENRAGARRPEQTGGHSEHERTADTGSFRAVLTLNFSAEANERLREIFGECGKEQSQTQQCENHDGENSAYLIGAHDPRACERDDAGYH